MATSDTKAENSWNFLQRMGGCAVQSKNDSTNSEEEKRGTATLALVHTQLMPRGIYQ